MRHKPLIFLSALLAIVIFITGCEAPAKDALPAPVSLEESIKQIILSKGENYNFLEDELYMEHMEDLGMELVKNKLASPPHFAIGNLDDDNIPELAVFQERDPDNTADEGSLELYKFNGEKYMKIDSVSMNYDNGNYQITIGKISENQNGILLNNEVGAHSGITYGFILEDNKFKSIFDHQKTSLISIYSENEIKDIDNDGILEFSVYTIDPETEDSSSTDSDKMTLWYKWDGKDAVNLIDVDRKDYSQEPSNPAIYEEVENLIENNFSEVLSFLETHKDELSKYHNTQLLMKYTGQLNEMAFDKGIEIENLFIKYQHGENFDYLFQKYGLSTEILNSLEYLNREKVLKDEEDLKKHLIDNISLGYKLETSEGIYYYVIDNQKFIDIFGENITNEYKDYLKILALDTNEPFMSDGSLIISMEKLAERILFVESFKMVYPYSELLPKVNEIYKWYTHTYFYGDLHDPNFEHDTLKIKDEILEEFNKAIDKYSYTNFADTIKYFLELLKENNYVINDDIRDKFNERLK